MNNKLVNENSPKLQQFVLELNVLLEKYSYESIIAVLEFTDRGITPALRMVDKIPPLTPPTNAEPATITLVNQDAIPEGGVPTDG